MFPESGLEHHWLGESFWDGPVAMWARVVSLWGSVGMAFHSVEWSKLASTLASTAAFVYSLILIGEWWWKRIGRPLAESRGWLVRRMRRRNDYKRR